MGRGGAILTPTNSFLLLEVLTSVPILVKIKKCDCVSAHRQTDRQTQTDFIICPMLYAIAMGQIRIEDTRDIHVNKLKYINTYKMRKRERKKSYLSRNILLTMKDGDEG